MAEVFERLEVWKRSCRLAVQMYEILEPFREHSLKNQMTRAAVSIASNIAEGSERGSEKEFIRFLRISKGSAAELRTQLWISGEAGLLQVDSMRVLVEEVMTISRMLEGLIRSKHRSQDS